MLLLIRMSVLISFRTNALIGILIVLLPLALKKTLNLTSLLNLLSPLMLQIIHLCLRGTCTTLWTFLICLSVCFLTANNPKLVSAISLYIAALLGVRAYCI